jgi:hypothetical protein
MTKALNTVAATLSGILTIAGADDPAWPLSLQSLLDGGSKVIAEGQLIETIECDRWDLRVLPKQPPDDCKAKYGSFQRLRNNDDEFVCVSFRGWTCYRSETRN